MNPWKKVDILRKDCTSYCISYLSELKVSGVSMTFMMLIARNSMVLHM
jgi:hypothetical protein